MLLVYVEGGGRGREPTLVGIFSPTRDAMNKSIGVSIEGVDVAASGGISK